MIHERTPSAIKDTTYFITLKIRFQRGPLFQLNQIKDALPTIFVSGTKPQNLLS